MAPGTWGRFFAQVKDAGASLAYSRPRHPSQYPLARSDFYGSSLNFEIALRIEHRYLIVPERECQLRTCDGCRDGGPPSEPAPHEPGTVAWVCPECWRTPYDGVLDAQRLLAGDPPREPAEAPTAPRKPRKRVSGVIRMRRGRWFVATKATASAFVAWCRAVPTEADDPEDEPGEVFFEYGDSRSEAVSRLERSLAARV